MEIFLTRNSKKSTHKDVQTTTTTTTSRSLLRDCFLQRFLLTLLLLQSCLIYTAAFPIAAQAPSELYFSYFRVQILFSRKNC